MGDLEGGGKIKKGRRWREREEGRRKGEKEAGRGRDG